MKKIKYHLIDIHGNRVSDIDFDNCAWFQENAGEIHIKEKKYIYNLENSLLSPVPFDDAWYGSFTEGLGLFEINKKKGFINREGQVVLPPVYDSVHHSGFLHGEAYVKLKYEDSLLRIDKTGKILADLGQGWSLEYRTPDGRGNCYYRIENDEYWYYVADKNRENSHGPYKEVGNFKEGMRYLKIEEEANEMYVDAHFEKIFEKPDWCSYMSTSIDEGRLLIIEGKKHKVGFLDRNGEVIIKPVFLDCEFFSENRAAYKKGRLWGIIDEQGQEIVPPMYDYIHKYSDGCSQVCLKNKYGFIGRNGEITIPLEYDDARPFHEGIAAVGISTPMS